MTSYGFIDESGTGEDQSLMTVALLLLPGARTAQNVQQKIIAEVDAGHGASRLRHKKERTSAPQKLHFNKMHDAQKESAGKVLAKANVQAILVGSHWYENGLTHAERFQAYEAIVKELVIHALRNFDDELVVQIARQGGWQTDGPPFIQRLRQDVQDRVPHRYRFLSASTLVSTIPGIQLADFCASSARASILHNLKIGFEHIEHRIDWITSKDLMLMEAKK